MKHAIRNRGVVGVAVVGYDVSIKLSKAGS
jgi:hypothetical protein